MPDQDPTPPARLPDLAGAENPAQQRTGEEQAKDNEEKDPPA